MNVPNTLTIIRILLTPVFLILFEHPDSTMKAYGIIIFFIASFTDWYDGYYARRYNVVTRFGQFMDPLADKVLNLSATFILAAQGFVHWWIIYTIIIRDIYLTLLRFYALASNRPVITSRVAQWKTAIHMLLLLITMSLVFFEHVNDWHILNLEASYSSILGIGWLVVAAMSIYTAIDYMVYNWSLFIKIWRRFLKLLRLI